MLTRRTLLGAAPAAPLAVAATPAFSTPLERIAFHAAELRKALDEAVPEADSRWFMRIMGKAGQGWYASAESFDTVMEHHPRLKSPMAVEWTRGVWETPR